VPGDVSLAAILSLPAIITAHTRTPLEAGYVAFGSTIIVLTGTALSPIGILMLPHATQLFVEGRQRELRALVHKLSWVVGAGAVLAVAIAEALMPSLLALVFAVRSTDAVLVLRVMLPGLVPYALYASIRSVVDAAHPEAINARNNMIALASFGVAVGGVHVIGAGLWGVPAAAAFALGVLGLLAWLEVRAALPKSVEDGA
jgi:O-antigen/teichoic acid export membrane protein